MIGNDDELNIEFTVSTLLNAYRAGIFPMGLEDSDYEIYWECPEVRAVIPLDAFHIPKRFRREMRKANLDVSINRDFGGVILGCSRRDSTWINKGIIALYNLLFLSGYAHSVEVWEKGDLVGGLYGVALGRAFFGESMFSHRTNASKIALVYLVDQLRRTGFALFDTQYQTPHLERFGAVCVTRREYNRLLANSQISSADLSAQPLGASASAVLQRVSQTS